MWVECGWRSSCTGREVGSCSVEQKPRKKIKKEKGKIRKGLGGGRGGGGAQSEVRWGWGVRGGGSGARENLGARVWGGRGRPKKKKLEASV